MQVSESAPPIGDYPRPLIWGRCGLNSTVFKQDIYLHSNCIKHIKQNEIRLIDDNRITTGLRIISRTTASLHEAPYAVRIIYETPQTKFKCSGSIIANEWVLTTARCAG